MKTKTTLAHANRAAAAGAARATMLDIARHLGLSKGTVSLALNDAPGVNAETRRRVKEYAQAVRYRPNQLARAIHTGRSQLVAVVLARLTDSFFEEIVQGIENVASRREYDVIVASVSGESAQERARAAESLVDRLIGRQIDGLIGSELTLPESARALLADAGVPTLYLGPEPLPGKTSVTVDHALGGRLAAEHLWDLGHRHVLFVGANERYSRLRLAGARAVFEERGGAAASGVDWCLESRTLSRGALDVEGAYFAVASRLHLRPRGDFTALFCSSDLLAVGACKAILDAGLSIPGDLSVVGYDDLRWTRLLTPSLTSVHQPQVSQGEAAMEILLARIEGGGEGGPSALPGSRLLEPRLVARDSSGPAPPARRPT